MRKTNHRLACASFLLLGIMAAPGWSAVVDVTLDTLHSGFQVEGDTRLWADLSYTSGMTYAQAKTWADGFDFEIAGREDVAMLFDALLDDGAMRIPEREAMGGFVVSGYNSARGFFDDGTDNDTAGEADCTYATSSITDDSLAASYYDSRFAAFVIQIPEPGTLGLVLGVGGLAAIGRRRAR